MQGLQFKPVENPVDIKEMILMGRIGAPWGVRGYTRIQSYAAPEANLFQYDAWYLKHNGTWFLFELEESKQNGNGLVARLKGVDDRDLAQSLTHAEIYITKSMLPACERDQFYWTDLEGLKVINTAGEDLGCVDFLYEIGAQENMVVKGSSGQERHIPFVMGDTIQNVDLEKGQIQVDWSIESC